MAILYNVLYGKDSDHSHLRIIRARAFVHNKDVNKLCHPSWEGLACGFRQC